MNLDVLGLQVKEIVQEAGALVLSYYQQHLAHQVKKDGSFATQADLASEKYLIERLGILIPGASFFAEESGITHGNDYCWVIDPLDGTTNFARGIPYFCISVALTHHDKRLLGVVFSPLLNELFYAVKGGGAFLNNKPLHTVAQQKLARACIGFSLPYEHHNDLCKLVHQLEPRVYSCRVLGAAALEIAYTALGRLDAVLFEGLFWWDMAAASLIVEEAGGVVSELNGTSLSSTSRSFIGGSKPIVQELKRANCCCIKD